MLVFFPGQSPEVKILPSDAHRRGCRPTLSLPVPFGFVFQGKHKAGFRVKRRKEEREERKEEETNLKV